MQQTDRTSSHDRITRQSSLERFFFKSSRNQKGNGLGLAIVKKDMSPMGGEVKVLRRKTEGTSFGLIFSETTLTEFFGLRFMFV